MRRIGLHLLVGLAALLAPLLLQPSTALALSFTVNSTLDEPDANPGDGQCVSAPSGVCTLRAAIMEANGRGGSHTISLPSGTFKLTIPGNGEDGGATGDLDVYTNLTITGAGSANTVIDGNQIDRIIERHTGSSSLTLSGLTLQNSPGEGVQMLTGTLALIDSRVTGNLVGVSGATVTLTGTTADHNIQAIIADTVTFSNGTLAGNNGFGISTIGHGDITVTNSTLNNPIDAGRDLTMTNTTMNGSGIVVGRNALLTSTTTSGISSNGGTVTLRDSQILNGGGINAPAVVLENSTVSGNSNIFFGGILAGTVTLTNSTVSGNFGPSGGVSAQVSVTLVNSTVSQNIEKDSGGMAGQRTGGISSPSIVLTASKVTGNTGGGISASTLTMTDSEVSGNKILSGSGGGINVGMATVTGSTISGNTASTSGGGIFLSDGATLTLTNSTISGNSAPTGGGIAQAGSATLHFLNSTIASNSATTNGSGLYKLGGSADVRNTIVANNTGSANCFHVTPFTSVGHNIDSGASCGFSNAADMNSTDPKLGPLTNNGGPTQTMALLSGSPAIDAANPDGCPSTDQRGIARPQDGDGSPPATCDIGAFEAAANTTPPPTTCAPRPPVAVTATPDGSGGLRVTVSTSGTGGALSALQFGAATNAQITAPGGPANVTGSSNVSPPAGATTFTFTVRRATAGQAVQVPFTVVDACGIWPTFAGGGPSAF